MGLVKFIGKLRELSDGKPIGIKMCMGHPHEFEELCLEMKKKIYFLILLQLMVVRAVLVQLLQSLVTPLVCLFEMV